MTVESSKVVAYGMTGAENGITSSKIVVYAFIVPGTEAAATPPANQGYTYAQQLRRPT